MEAHMDNPNCRISYDKHFVVKRSEKPKYNNKVIDGISLWFQYKYYQKDSEKISEIYFSEDEYPLPPCFYTCSYDDKTGYKMKLNQSLFDKYSYSNVIYIPDDCGCDIWFQDEPDPCLISFETAINILKSYPKAFNYSTNNPTQCLAYRMQEVPYK